MVTGWRRLANSAIAGLALTLCPLAALADDRDDCNSIFADTIISGCSAIIDAGTETARNAAITYGRRGNAYYDKGDLVRAMEDFERAVELNPSSALAYFNRGAIHHAKGNTGRAIEDFDRAIELDPKFTRALNDRGVAYANQGNTSQAIKDFDRVIELNPKFVPAYYNRGLAYSSKGNIDRALKDYDRAIELNPEDAVYLNSRCWVRAVAGTSLGLARADCDMAIAISKNEPNYLDSRGLVGIKQGLFDKAWSDYDAAHRAKPDNAGFLYGRGIAALRLGRKAEGNADLAAALKLDGKIAKTYAGYGVLPP